MTDLKRIYQSDLPSRAIAVYLYLRGRANKEGVCWPAIPTMARELKMSESTVRRGVRDLEKAGFLSVEERFRWNKADSARVKYCSQKGFLKKEKLRRRSQYRLNRLFTEIRSGRGPIFCIFHEVSGN